jgi:diketogulonate reductase-like aldo/keto reductase
METDSPLRRRSPWHGSWRRSRGSCRLGTTKLPRLEENIGAAAIELTAEDLREIETASSEITVQGARYPEQIELTGR